MDLGDGDAGGGDGDDHFGFVEEVLDGGDGRFLAVEGGGHASGSAVEGGGGGLLGGGGEGGGGSHCAED